MDLSIIVDFLGLVLGITGMLFIVSVVIPRKLDWKYYPVTAIGLLVLAFIQVLVVETNAWWDIFFDFLYPVFVGVMGVTVLLGGRSGRGVR